MLYRSMPNDTRKDVLMNLNQSIRLSELPKVNIDRSKFDRSHKHTTTFNCGRLVPIYLSEVLPGSTIKIETSVVCRLQTLIRPLMDNLYLDTYFFFVPNRLVFEHWEEFMGENKTSAWTPSVVYTKPKLQSPSGGFSSGSIADYFGLPLGVGGVNFDAMPFRAYAKICNEYFRDENLQTPLVIPTDGSTYVGVSSSTPAIYDDQISGIHLGGAPFIAGKYHDRFTSCLPYPQKHSDVSFPLSGFAPVVPANASLTTDMLKAYNLSTHQFNGYEPLTWFKVATNPTQATDGYLSVDAGGDTVLDTSGSGVSGTEIFPSNLVANLNYGISASINDLRMSLAIQRLYERDAMYGSRYQEQLLGQFGVRSADYRLQRPEFLGGDHIPLNISQVVNVSSPSVSTQDPLGHVGGYSLTGSIHKDVLQSFTEHGLIIGVAVVRYEHSYQQGVHKMWSRFDRLDYYYPVFAEISNQPILNKEIYLSGNSSVDNGVFGYQEAWYDYRYGDYNHVTGQMRSGISGTLDSFHLADYYSTTPSLSSSWIREDVNNVDRVLAVSSSVSDQVIADFYFKEDAVLPLPLYSIPSISDMYIK